MTTIHIPNSQGRTCPTCGAPTRRLVVLFGREVCDLCLAAVRHYLGIRSQARANRDHEAVAR